MYTACHYSYNHVYYTHACMTHTPYSNTPCVHMYHRACNVCIVLRYMRLHYLFSLLFLFVCNVPETLIYGKVYVTVYAYTVTKNLVHTYLSRVRVYNGYYYNHTITGSIPVFLTVN